MASVASVYSRAFADVVQQKHLDAARAMGELNQVAALLREHAPLITELTAGQLSFRSAGETHYLAVAWGFAEVLPEKVTVLAETAERAEDIDVNRAEQAKERAEKRLASSDPEVDVRRAQQALAKALARLEAAKQGSGVPPG